MSHSLTVLWVPDPRSSARLRGVRSFQKYLKEIERQRSTGSPRVIAGGETGRPSDRDPKGGYGVIELRVPFPRAARSHPGSNPQITQGGGMRTWTEGTSN